MTVGDYNNDGFEDLFVTYYGRNVLYRNNGDGTFTDVTKQAGLTQAASLWGSGCTFLDYNRDGHLDLFVANYVDFDLSTVQKRGSSAYSRWKGVSVCCGPRGLEPAHNYLFRNNGDGTFADVSAAAGISQVGNRYPLTSVAADFDDDGWTDIRSMRFHTKAFFFTINMTGLSKNKVSNVT